MAKQPQKARGGPSSTRRKAVKNTAPTDTDDTIETVSVSAGSKPAKHMSGERPSAEAPAEPDSPPSVAVDPEVLGAPEPPDPADEPDPAPPEQHDGQAASEELFAALDEADAEAAAEEAEEDPEPDSELEEAPVAAAAEKGADHFPVPSSFNLTPERFMRYWKRLPPRQKKRALGYVYRIWPTINRQKVDSQQKKYIDKIGEPLDPRNWDMESRHRWGSGDYKIWLNDTGNNRTVAQTVYKTERDYDTYPPQLNLEELEARDTINADYVHRLRARGIKIPGYEDNEDPTDMPDSKDDSAISTLAKVIAAQMNTNSGGGSEATTAAMMAGFSVLGESMKGGIAVVNEAAQKANELLAKGQDPYEAIDRIMNVIKKAYGDSDETKRGNSGEVAMLDRMMTMQADHAKAMQETHTAQLKQMGDQVANLQRQVTKASNPEQDSETTGLSGMAKNVEDIKALTTGLQDLGLVGAAGAAASKTSWVDLIPQFTPLITDAVGRIATAIMMGRGATPPAPGATATPPAAGSAPPTDGQPQPPTDGINTDQLAIFAAQIRDPMLSHFREGRDGVDFAQWFMEGWGVLTYRKVRAMGRDRMIAVVRSDPALSQQLTGSPQQDQHVAQFIDEFLGAEETLANQADQEPAPESEPAGPVVAAGAAGASETPRRPLPQQPGAETVPD